MSAVMTIDVVANTASAQSNFAAFWNNVESGSATAQASTTATTGSMMGLASSTARFAGLGVSTAAAFDMMSAYGERYAMMNERIVIAQENVTKALMSYGAGSIQVVQAQQQLVAVQDEAKYAQGEYNRELLMMSAMILPQMIGMIPSLTHAFENMGVAEKFAAIAGFELSDAELAIVTMGIGAIAMIGTLAAVGGFGGPGGGGGSSNVNVYGDVNMAGYANPYQFGTSVQSWTQSMRG